MAAPDAMTTGILIIAHAPLASALRQCVLHVFPDSADAVAAVDVDSTVAVEQSLQDAQACMAPFEGSEVLVLTDVFGATPFNIAQKLVDGRRARLVAGVNLPMLLRAVTYRREALDVVVARAIAGGVQGVMQVSTAAPQNQGRKRNDQSHHDHQQ
jgi:PTS system mannose-specific IIA component